MSEAISRRRPAQLLPVSVALSVSADGVSGALVAESGKVLTEKSAVVRHGTVKSTADAAGRLIVDLAAESVRERYELKAIGIAIDGSIDHETDRVTFGGRTGFQWARVPLRTMIEETLEESGVDIRLPLTASPVRAARVSSAHPMIALCTVRAARALAEGWIGTAEGKSNIVFLSLSENLTAGLVVDGIPVKGAGDMSGAIAWLALSESFRDEYSASGSLGYELGANALVRRTVEKWTPDADSVLGKLLHADPTAITAPTIIRAARGGDTLAMGVVSEACGVLGRVIASITALLNPEAVVIDGSYGQMLKPFLGDIRHAAKQWMNPLAYRQCSMSFSRLGTQGIFIGAAKHGFDCARRIQE